MPDPLQARDRLAEAEAWAYEPHNPQFPYRTGRLIDALAALVESQASYCKNCPCHKCAEQKGAARA